MLQDYSDAYNCAAYIACWSAGIPIAVMASTADHLVVFIKFLNRLLVEQCEHDRRGVHTLLHTLNQFSLPRFHNYSCAAYIDCWSCGILNAVMASCAESLIFPMRLLMALNFVSLSTDAIKFLVAVSWSNKASMIVITSVSRRERYSLSTFWDLQIRMASRTASTVRPNF